MAFWPLYFREKNSVPIKKLYDLLSLCETSVLKNFFDFVGNQIPVFRATGSHSVD
jgi:hypothetical protein